MYTEDEDMFAHYLDIDEDESPDFTPEWTAQPPTHRRRLRVTSSLDAPEVQGHPVLTVTSDENPDIDFTAALPPQLDYKKEYHHLLKKEILYKPKEDSLMLNLNITNAANYLAELLSVYRVYDRLYFFNWKAGVFEPQSQLNTISILKKYFDAVDNSLWRHRYANELQFALSTSVRAKKPLVPIANFLAFQNGTLALDSLKLLPHSPTYGATNKIPHNYDEYALCPIFDDALATIFKHDDSVISCFWEMLGYFLHYGSSYPLQKFFIFLGDGSNGKSLLLKVIRYTLGTTNCSSARLEDISSSDFGASMFFGSMLNVSPEIESQKPISTGLLKAVTGGDDITINAKNKAPFSAKVYTKFLFATNNVFTISDNSFGIFRRMQVFPFTQTFHELPPNGKRKPGVLYAEKDLFARIQPEVSGIINKALAGLQRLQENGWTMTKSLACADALQLFQVSSPSVLIHDFCVQYLKPEINSRLKQTAVRSLFEKFLTDSGVDENIKQGLISKSNLKKLYSDIEKELQTLHPNADIFCGKSNSMVFHNLTRA